MPVDVSGHLDDTGYMVFPGPGLMRLTARDARRMTSSVVIEVPSISLADYSPMVLPADAAPWLVPVNLA